MDSVDFYYIVLPMVCLFFICVVYAVMSGEKRVGCFSVGCFSVAITFIFGGIYVLFLRYDNNFIARAYYEAKCDNGDKSANLKLGDFYYQDANFEKALKYYEQADLYGYCSAQGYYNLGLLYENGLGGVYKDIKRSIGWYEKSVNLGHAKACRNLAFDYYECGYYEKAFDMARIAVSKGFECASFIVADCYYYGNVVEKDIELARDFYGTSTRCYCDDDYCETVQKKSKSNEKLIIEQMGSEKRRSEALEKRRRWNY